MNVNKRNAGQGLVEWALIMPVVFYLLFAMIDFGMAISKQHLLNQVAKEMARSASVGKSINDLGTAGEALCKNLISSNAVSISESSGKTIMTFSGNGTVTIIFDPSLTLRIQGQTIHVTANYTYKPITPLINLADFNLVGDYYSVIEVNAT